MTYESLMASYQRFVDDGVAPAEAVRLVGVLANHTERSDGLLDIDQVAAFLKSSTRHVRRLDETGELRALRSGSLVRWEPAALQLYVQTLRAEAGGQADGGLSLLDDIAS